MIVIENNFATKHKQSKIMRTPGQVRAQLSINRTIKKEHCDVMSSGYFKQFQSCKEASRQIKFNRVFHEQNLKHNYIQHDPDQENFTLITEPDESPKIARRS